MILNVAYSSGIINLIAGDTGVPDLRVDVADPWGNLYPVMSGSKTEHGPGGFEVVCPPGDLYTIKVAGDSWHFQHKPGVTFLTWEVEPEPPTVSVSPSASTSASPSPSPVLPSPSPIPPSPSPQPPTPTPVANWAELLHKLDIIIALLTQIRDRQS